MMSEQMEQQKRAQHHGQGLSQRPRLSELSLAQQQSQLQMAQNIARQFSGGVRPSALVQGRND